MDRDCRVAVYWDLENVVASQYNAVHGKGAWVKRFALDAKKHEAACAAAHVDLGAVLELSATIGVTTINRAYADWSSPAMSRYAGDLLRHSIDLVQLFPLAGSKNGADIRLAIDVVEDLSHHGHVTDVLLVTGDSDFVSLVQRCKRHGRRVTGVGVRGSVSVHLTSSCDLFRYYDALVAKSSAVPRAVSASTVVPVAARHLVATALGQLAASTEDGWVQRARVKPVLLRLDPSFDEADSGARSFSDFMQAVPAVSAQVREKDVYYRLIVGPRT